METWCPFATRQDGPEAKQGYASFPKRRLWDIAFVVGHSMEGSLSAALGELIRPERQASWTFSNPKEGPLLQHYPLESVTWHAGSISANFLGIGVENEGVGGELLNANQRKNFADLLTWLKFAAPTLSHMERGSTLMEHREMTEYGSPPTACPSNRIPWAQILTLMEDDMTPEERDWLDATYQRVTAIYTRIMDEDAFGKVRERIEALEQDVEALKAELSTGAHVHEPGG